jgi:hypothetical protein
MMFHLGALNRPQVSTVIWPTGVTHERKEKLFNSFLMQPATLFVLSLHVFSRFEVCFASFFE